MPIVTKGNIDDFVGLVEQSTYPMDQSVLKLEDLPQKCMTEDIHTYFDGLYSQYKLIEI